MPPEPNPNAGKDALERFVCMHAALIAPFTVLRKGLDFVATTTSEMTADQIDLCQQNLETALNVALSIDAITAVQIERKTLLVSVIKLALAETEHVEQTFVE